MNPASTHLGDVEPNELVRRALRGCAEAYRELSRRFRPRLIHVLRPRLGGHLADAEDVAQETLARAFRELHRFQPQYRFTTWLYTIAFRLAHDHRRQSRRHAAYVELDVASTPSRIAPPHVNLELREGVDNLWRVAKSLLTETLYTPLWLRYGEELSLADVARILGKTQVGVRVQLYRARRILVYHARQHTPEATP